jgi:hypothetical protein
MKKYLIEKEQIQGPRCGQRWYEVTTHPQDGIIDGLAARPVAEVANNAEALGIVEASEGGSWTLYAAPFFETVIQRMEKQK